jgi:AcrR family transcriptional regulator
VLATIDAAGSLPLAEVSVLEITTRAGVSRKTFYELFEQRGDCMLAALESTVARLTEATLPAYEAERGWVRQVRAGLAELLRFFDEHPAHGRFCVRAAFDEQPALRGFRDDRIARLAAALDGGQPKGAPSLASPITAETLIGGVLALLHRRLLTPGSPPCVELLNPILAMIVLPFRGAAAARAELHAPAPPTRPSLPAETIDNPLQGVQTRLTYRTLRVLRAIEQLPGSSNGRVATAAGLGDLGQTSKLLKRLEGLELIVNDGRRTGEPNAWRLTPRAERMLATISKAAVPRATRQGA